MAITVVGTKTAYDSKSSASDTNNHTISFSGISIQPGDVVLVFVSIYGASANGPNVSVSSAGYTSIKSISAYQGTYVSVANLYYKVMGQTPDSSVSIAGNGTPGYYAYSHVVVLRGVDTSAVVEGSAASTTGTDDPLSCGSKTPANDGMFFIFAHSGSVYDNLLQADFTPPSGFSTISTTGPGYRTASMVFSKVGTKNVSQSSAVTGLDSSDPNDRDANLAVFFLIKAASTEVLIGEITGSGGTIYGGSSLVDHDIFIDVTVAGGCVLAGYAEVVGDIYLEEISSGGMVYGGRFLVQSNIPITGAMEMVGTGGIVSGGDGKVYQNVNETIFTAYHVPVLFDWNSPLKIMPRI